MKGICFKEPLFLATIEGRKTQTRRTMKPQPGTYCTKCKKSWLACRCEFDDDRHANRSTKTYAADSIPPRYKPGDVVYLKEPYYTIPKDTPPFSQADRYLYAYGRSSDVSPRWQNKLFMPAEAARYFIKITAVRAERLQDISDEDCMKEGIIPFDETGKRSGFNWGGDSRYVQYLTPRDAYSALINRINGKGKNSVWSENPYVFVYDYQLCDKYGSVEEY